MPGRGYSTLNLKPRILAMLANVTDTFYPGMFFPSTLIMLMNEVKLGRFAVAVHDYKMDLTGRWSTLTIRADIKEWIEQNYDESGAEYRARYGTKLRSEFVGLFLFNLFESKYESQGSVIRLRESDWKWLRAEYERQKTSREWFQGMAQHHDSAERAPKPTDGAPVTFDAFASAYVREMLFRMRVAKKLLSE